LVSLLVWVSPVVPLPQSKILETSVKTRDRCYDLKNIFAEKWGENMAFFVQNTVSFFTKFGSQNWFLRKCHFFRRKWVKIEETCDHSRNPGVSFWTATINWDADCISELKYVEKIICAQRAILNITPGPQGWNLSPRGEVHPFVHPQGWTLSTV
jgi:hypothetical protein